MTNSCYFFRKIRDMRPNNDARVDLKRRVIVLPKITFVLYGSLLGRLEYKVPKSMKLSKYRIAT
jgi:hypothetical protein